MHRETPRPSLFSILTSRRTVGGSQSSYVGCDVCQVSMHVANSGFLARSPQDHGFCEVKALPHKTFWIFTASTQSQTQGAEIGTGTGRECFEMCSDQTHERSGEYCLGRLER